MENTTGVNWPWFCSRRRRARIYPPDRTLTRTRRSPRISCGGCMFAAPGEGDGQDGSVAASVGIGLEAGGRERGGSGRRARGTGGPRRERQGGPRARGGCARRGGVGGLPRV